MSAELFAVLIVLALALFASGVEADQRRRARRFAQHADDAIDLTGGAR